jgi:hypothetical protein
MALFIVTPVKTSNPTKIKSIKPGWEDDIKYILVGMLCGM